MGKKLLFNNYNAKKNNDTIPVTNGLVCWLDGKSGVNGETIWNDKTGNNNNAELLGFTFDGVTNGFINNELLCSQDNKTCVQLPDVFYNTNSHTFFCFSSFKTPALTKFPWQRLFTFGNNLNNINAVALECGTSSTSFKFNNSNILTLDRNVVLGANECNFCYAYSKENLTVKTKFNQENLKTFKATLLNGVNFAGGCYLNRESKNTFNPRDVGYSLILLYNRELSDNEIQEIYNYYLERKGN